MPDIALLCRPGAFWGAEEAGISTVFPDDPGQAEDQLLRLARGGCRIVIVTEDLVKDRLREILAAVEAAAPKTAVLVLPAPGRSMEVFYEYLRGRFAVALGIDVWKTTASKTGAEL